MGITITKPLLFQLLPTTNMVSATVKATRLIEKYVGCEKRLSNKWIGVPNKSITKKITGVVHRKVISMYENAQLMVRFSHLSKNKMQLLHRIDVEIDETSATSGYLRNVIESL